MINQELSLFEVTETLGIAQCSVVYDNFSKVENIICTYCNKIFADFLSSSVEDLIHHPISLPNYDLIAYLNETAPLNNILYSVDKEHYKIEVIKNTELPSQISIILTNITKQIEYHNLQYKTNYTTSTASALEESFLNLVNNSQEPMLLFSGGDFLLCNHTAAEFLGYDSPEEIMNMSPIDLSPEYQPNGMSSADLSPILNGKAIENGYSRFEWVHLRKDKSMVEVEVSLTHMVLRNQPVLHCVWRDLSKTKQLEEAIVLEQQRTLDQLSIPITQIFRNILLLPLIGNITAIRAQNILQKVLQKIADTQSKVIILDIAGIDDMTVLAAQSLIKLSNATRMMGCKTILSGVTGNIAEMLSNLEMDISTIESAGTLENAIYRGFATLGIDINFKDK